MNLNETSCTVASATSVIVNGSEALTGFPLLAHTGSVTRPSYSFASSINTGMYLTSRDMSMSVQGQRAWSVADNANVNLFGGGGGGTVNGSRGVVYMSPVVTPPSTPPNGGHGGGVVYVEGAELKYMNASGGVSSLTSFTGNVTGPAGVGVDGTVARFSGTSGNVVEAAPGFEVDVTGVAVPSGGLPSSPTYGFLSAPDTGMYSPVADEVAIACGGVRRLHLSSSVLTCDVGCVASTYTFSGGGSGRVSVSSSHLLCGPSLAVGPNSNVALGNGDAPPLHYGEGRSVVYIHPATTSPSAPPPSDSALLWVSPSTESLLMMSPSGTVIDLTKNLKGPEVSSDNALALVNGTTGNLLKSSSVFVTDTGEVLTPRGSDTAPSYSFEDVSGSGMYSGGASTLNICVDSSDVMQIVGGSVITVTPPRVAFVSGSASVPGMTWNGATNTGFYLTPDSGVAASVGGDTCFVGSASRNVTLCGEECSDYGGGSGVMFMNVASVDPTGPLVNRGLVYIPSGGSGELAFYNTSPASVILSRRIYGGDTSTNGAMARWGSDGSGKTMESSSFTLDGSGVITGPSGSESAPTFSFGGGGHDTGLFVEGSDTLGISVSGSRAVNVGSTHVSVVGRVRCPDGGLASPAMSFTTEPTTGMFRPSAGLTCLVSDGVVGFTASPNGNVTLGSSSVDVGGGTRVVRVENVSVAPTGSASGSGGRVYVNGAEFHFHDQNGGDVNLLRMASTSGGGDVVSGSVARYDGVSGGLLTDSGFFITNPVSLDFPGVGVPTSPTFSFASDTTTGLYWSSSTSGVLATSGVDRVRLEGSAVSLSVDLHADVSLRVGGGGGGGGEVVTSVVGTTAVTNAASGGGSFEWKNATTGDIMKLNSSELLLSTSLVQVDGTNTLSMGYNGTEFEVMNSSGTTPLGVDVRIGTGTSAVLAMGTSGDVSVDAPNTVMTVVNRMLVDAKGSTSTYDYAGTPVNRGLTYTSNGMILGFGATRPMYFSSRHNMFWCGEPSVGNDVEGVIAMYDVSTIPSGVQAAGVMSLYVERTTGVFGVGGLTPASSKRTVLDGHRSRAIVTRTALGVNTGVVTNTEGGGGVWSVNDEYGVNGTSTGELGTPDTCYVCCTAHATWSGAHASGHRRLSIMRKTAGPVYTLLNSVTTMGVSGDATGQRVCFFGKLVGGTDSLTVQVYQDSGFVLDVDLRVSVVRYDSAEPV